MKYIFLLLSTFLYSQNEPKLVNAKTNSNAIIGQEFAFGCTLDIKEVLNVEEPLVLYGYYKCSKLGNVEFYNAFWNNDVYYIKASDVEISEEDDKYLKSLDSKQQAALLDNLIVLMKEKNEALKNELKEKVKPISAKGKLNGMLIGKSNVFDQSEYTDGTGYQVIFANTSKKTIKYIWFSVKGINAVDDAVGIKTVKCIGPVKPEEIASYSFDYMWLTDIVERSRLTAIKIQYMDGTIKQIVKPNDLIIDEDIFNIIFNVDED